jgi:hypothetical protein
MKVIDWISENNNKILNIKSLFVCINKGNQ